MFTLLACTASFAPAGLTDLELLALTDASPMDALPGRARVDADSPARLAPDAPGFAGEGGWGTYAVVTADEQVRIVSSREDIRLLLWVERDGLADVMPETTWVDAHGGRADDGAPGVRIPAGTHVELDLGVGASGGTIALASPQVDDVLGVADALVDQVWTVYTDDDAAAGATPAADERLPSLGVEGGAELRDDDGGVLLSFSDAYRDTIIATGRLLKQDPALGLYVYVSLGISSFCEPGPEVYARGWVWPSDTDAHAWSGFGGGCSSCGGFRFRTGNAVELPAGALLYDAPDGTPVGVTEQLVELEPGVDDGAMPGWRAVMAPSAWGEGQVWARAAGEGLERWDAFAPIEVREVDRGAVGGRG